MHSPRYSQETGPLSDRRSITRDRHADALAAFAAARARMPPSPPLPGPFTARATALPGTLIWHASTSESHSTSALHSTHQLAPHATLSALYANPHICAARSWPQHARSTPGSRHCDAIFCYEAHTRLLNHFLLPSIALSSSMSAASEAHQKKCFQFGVSLHVII